MSTEHAERQAGGFARQRFRDRRRAWRRRHWWAFPLLAVVPIAVELPIALLTHAQHSGLLIGVGLGAGAAATMILFDSPPAHVERWRIGADGEKATGKKLRPLLDRGWTLLNDIGTGHGNLDHVLVGPAGVFMLESKRLAGRVRVEAGKLVVRWHEDPEDGHENASIASRARGAAFDLHARLELPGQRPWVQAVVVLWADFEQRSIERDHVAWVRGDQLATVLADRPMKYSGSALEQLTAATRKAVTMLRPEPEASVEPQPGQRAAPTTAELS